MLYVRNPKRSGQYGKHPQARGKQLSAGGIPGRRLPGQYTATAGNAALKEVEKKPDIILLDVDMPDIDGFTVCERIRDYVSCPIIFLTARIEDRR